MGLYLYWAGVGGLLVDALDQLVADTTLVSIDGSRRRVPEIHLVVSDERGEEPMGEENRKKIVAWLVHGWICGIVCVLTPGSKVSGFDEQCLQPHEGGGKAGARVTPPSQHSRFDSQVSTEKDDASFSVDPWESNPERWLSTGYRFR